MMKAFAVTAAALVVVGIVMSVAPDIKRYIRITTM